MSEQQTWCNPVRARLAGGPTGIRRDHHDAVGGGRGPCGHAGLPLSVDRDGALADHAGDAAPHGAGHARTAGRGVRARAGGGVVDREARARSRSERRDLPVCRHRGEGRARGRRVPLSAGRQARIGRGRRGAHLAAAGQLLRLGRSGGLHHLRGGRGVGARRDRRHCRHPRRGRPVHRHQRSFVLARACAGDRTSRRWRARSRALRRRRSVTESFWAGRRELPNRFAAIWSRASCCFRCPPKSG